jgi:hypothetical protein
MYAAHTHTEVGDAQLICVSHFENVNFGGSTVEKICLGEGIGDGEEIWGEKGGRL